MSENIGNQDNREIIRSPFRADEEQPYIFISYSHKDRERVFPIIKRLYEQGWKIWYDEGLEIATNYLATLSQHIKNCAAFLLFVTENSVKSEFVCEKELIVASNYNKIISQCVLDEAAQFSGEAKDVLDIVTASRKHPKTNEAGLEVALETIEGLERGEPRAAKEITITSNRQIVTSDEGGEYEWTAGEGGVCLIRYRGDDEEVRVPSEYPAGSGQTVLELRGTFNINKKVRRIWIPDCVRTISNARSGNWVIGTFRNCKSLSDVYIPSSVEEIASTSFFGAEGVTIHCAEDSAAHAFAQENDLAAEFDESLRISAADRQADKKPYVYCSYSPAQKERVAKIMEELTEAGCEVLDGGSVKESEKLKVMRRSRCFAAFVSKEYIESDFVEELQYASDTGSNLMMYVLEDCTLPYEIEIRHPADQRLHYDSQTEDERITKLTEWLGKNGCRRLTGIPGFEYRATNDGITLTKYTGSGGEVVIEREYSGIPVVRIAPNAFSKCNGVTAVTIPDTVAEITMSMFESCSGLTSVVIPDSITKIDILAFRYCRGLTSISVPGSVTAIGRSAFYGCRGLTSISIPDTVTKINDSVFYGCSGLTSVTIPNSVTAIGESAFSGCSGLTSITIPASVGNIGERVFVGCNNLSRINVDKNNSCYCSADGVLMSKDITKLIAHPQKHGNSYEIPDSVTTIGEGAFFGCSGLTSVIIPDSVTTISESAFRGCSGLISVTIPNSVTAIGESAFSGCSGLTSITIPASVAEIGDRAFENGDNLSGINVDSANCQYCSVDGVLMSKDKTRLIAYPKNHGDSYEIPDSVTTIAHAAFSYCRGVTSVSIPDSVTAIDDSVFSGCSNLSSVTIPESVTAIGEGAFRGCSGLTSVIIPDSVTDIGRGVFLMSPNLTVYCSKDSRAWAYCEENDIPRKELTEAPVPSGKPAPATEPASAAEPAPAELCAGEPAPSESPVCEPAVEPVPQPEEPAPTPAKSPTRRSSAWWLIPAALALALGGAAAVQLTGLFDILGAIGSLLG